MLPVRNGLARPTSASHHICLSCRLKSQRRLRHTSTSALDATNTASISRFEQDHAAPAPEPHPSTTAGEDGHVVPWAHRALAPEQDDKRPPGPIRHQLSGSRDVRAEGETAYTSTFRRRAPRAPGHARRAELRLREAGRALVQGLGDERSEDPEAGISSGDDRHLDLVRKHVLRLPSSNVKPVSVKRLSGKRLWMKRLSLGPVPVATVEPLSDDVVGSRSLIKKQWITGKHDKVQEKIEGRKSKELDKLLDLHAAGGRQRTEVLPAMSSAGASSRTPSTSRLDDVVAFKLLPGDADAGFIDTPDAATGQENELGNAPLMCEQAKDSLTGKQGDAAPRSMMPKSGLGSKPSKHQFGQGMAWHTTPPSSTDAQARAYHTSTPFRQQEAATAEMPQPPPDLMAMSPKKLETPNGIRAQLRKWQELHGDEDLLHDNVDLGNDADTGELSNNLTRLPDEKTAFANTQAENEEDEREAMAHFTQAPSDEPSSSDMGSKFLKTGDLVEIEFVKSERESLVAVFVRRTGTLAQFYTMQGRWLHVMEKKVMYSIPGWVSEDTIKPILQYLPSPDEVENDLEGLMDESYIKDMSVPRHVAAPLVSRMVQFHAEAQEIYRRNASTLDNAHQLLAHETDLRYGSLVSAATTLLKTPADQLPVTALFAVRQALSHAGFAFNIDRRSHRLTGYLQIRSKEQVKMVEQVRRWLREWQDDLAVTATMDEQQARRHRATRGASYVYGFLSKAKKIIARSREDRQPTPYGQVGPSKVRLPITQEKDCVKVTKSDEFAEQDTELVRFLEAWSLSNMFLGLPRVESLPPLLLQATGLYNEYTLNTATGLLFLQELGTIMPYENRVRFDQHLLLPSSQHSRPLQNLMTSLIDMADKHNFVDSMADLRHDWGRLPVYCIDDASAHEIDDGLSIEPAAVASDGVKEWWVHIHIANPTAFFNRDHPLAKMARHMGESIYMPERTYMMLPRWATQRHFSLARDRPCLTFSARMDAEGRTLERKIRPGTIKNVLRLTPSEVGDLLGVSGQNQRPEMVLTVGGEPPPPKKRKSYVGEVNPEMVQELQTLRMLAEKRADIRKAAGGLFFDVHKPEINVWQSHKAPGLAWDHPHRRGSRHVEGDPVIQMKTKGLVNWFSASSDTPNVMVRECMLLACEVAAAWCDERAIPAVFRGSVPRPGKLSSDQFFEEHLAPLVAQRTTGGKVGDYPMHLGMQYLETFGTTSLSTRPFKHKILGMQNYGKVTSPLRRYGDMIFHWQIEAALREEATTGKSLITSNPDADRRFLPFSTPVLNTILIGLQPRESIIMKAKMFAENFWINLLLFRAHHYHETPLPLGNDNKTVHAYVHVDPKSGFNTQSVIVKELNVVASLMNPEDCGVHGQIRQGDVWECEVDNVDCFRRVPFLRPRNLVERAE